MSFTHEFNLNALLVLVVGDSIADKVIENIVSNTSTGLAGEGKIFVSNIDDAVDIGSRTKGEAAV
jgi:nitrogen regulatory protein P-II 1